MRKWRAENREKNRQNDLRCRVYRLARQKYGENDSSEKQGFVREEIARRLGRRMMMERREANGWTPPMRMRNGIRMMSPVHFTSPPSSPLISQAALLSPLSDLVQLPFYCAPQQKIELPSIDKFTRTNSWSSSPPDFTSSSSSTTSSPILPHLSPTLQRRTSSSSISSASSITSQQIKKERRRSSSVTKMETLSVNTTPIPSSCSYSSNTPITPKLEQEVSGDSPFCVLPSMHTFLSYASTSSAASAATATAAASSSSVAVDNKLQQQKQQQNSSCCIPSITTKGGIKYVDSNKILDEFVGVVLNYVDNATVAQ